MSSTNIYENLPLKKLGDSETSKNLISEIKQKKRKSTPDIQKVSSQNNISKKAKSSRSISEMLFNRSDDKSDENLSAGEKSNGEDSCKKIQSTPTSTLDDGYESCNSTPLVSGRAKPTKQHSNQATNLVLTCTLRKKDLHVQLEEDEKGYESFVLSTSSSQAGEVDPDSPTVPDDARETWGSSADFLLSIIGFAVDLANVWRFPYLCYKNGGGAFLVPYTLMLVFGAVPLFYMELILGQFNRQGPISLWRICPLFKGVGFCAVLVAFYVSFYYNVIIAWALYFLGTSFSPDLPWLHCNNTWNTEKCWESMLPGASNVTTRPPVFNDTTPTNRHTPASEFFHRAVLEMQWSDGLHEMGYPKWQLVLCLMIVYVMLYISLFKGVKSSGKVVWVTATMPYVVLTILLIRGLMLPGAAMGISYYLKPELSKLRETQVWVDAAVQIFYSVGAGFGVHLSYASYNTFHNNCFRDCIVTTAVNCFTSFFSGFVIFTYLGFMSYKQGVHISTVATEGPGLVFQVYPEAVATLPGSHFWSMLFFFMLIMLGLDSAMGGLECVITGLMDEYSNFFKSRKHSREIFTLGVIIVSFSVALINVTPGGIYTFNLFDTYSAGISLLCSALFEAIAVSWFYGLDRFTQDVEAMIGTRPGLYWRICWKFVSPTFIIMVVLFGLLNPQPLKYNDYFYPKWAEWVGWSLALSSIIMIPLVAVLQLIKTEGTFKEKLAISITPIEEHEEVRRSKLVSRFRARHWLFV
ncbi:sodium-dependent noradrenaline transporter isoform X1 [Tribolium castaneum]|uniref:Transporter n=1 Tax=Tribolium castaneum TaxID=7070 RepID=A0A139WF45_TRICA|nr:PREDICTED: sodium-dependent noradrenaline transporter isoform X1 [Tribolium castaneum]KYB26417.1 Sodium-dependent serotonin transporter-like Protein [Tribolium castaneum]|eukprot:XP_975356.1 PREDICTED: sodium-dependent noradrenaline transporter isoform X1 [Tribolium castaneum]